MRFETRSSYLTSLGVTQWYARKRLAGAAQTPQIEYCESSSLTGKPGKVEAVLLESSVGSAKALPADSSTGTSASLDVLSWMAYSIGDWVVVDEANRNAPNVHELEFLQNVLFACGKADASLNGQFGFDWPIFERSEVISLANIDQKKLVQRWFSGLPCTASTRMIYHGSAMKKAIDDLPEVQSMLNGGAYFDYSLAELINRPALKADYWAFLCHHKLVSAKP